MRIDDRILGVGLALLALFIVWQAQKIPSVPGTTFGPPLMPTLIGVVMAACALVIFVGGLRSAGKGPLIDVSVWRGQTRGLVCAAWAILGVVAGIAIMPWIGFPLFGLIYALPLMLLMGARPVAAVPAAVIVVICAYLVFKRVLYVPLPTGPLTFLG